MNYNLLWIVWFIWASALIFYLFKGENTLALLRNLSALPFIIASVITAIIAVVLRTLLSNKGIKMFKRKENAIKPVDQIFSTTPAAPASLLAEEKTFEYTAPDESVSASVVKVADNTTLPETCFFTGEINSAGDVHINGTVKGKVFSDKTVFVLAKGKVEGEIIAEKIEINGSLIGLCRSREVAVNASGFMDGTIECEALSINKNGRFYGSSKPFTPEKTPTEKPLSHAKNFVDPFSPIIAKVAEKQIT